MVLGIGGVTIDRTSLITHIPGWDSIEYVKRVSVQQGGMVATAMVAVKRLGFEAEFVGGIGDDAEGGFVLDSFRREGVNTGRIRIYHGEHTASSHVLVSSDSGKRAIIHHRGVQERESLDAGDIDLAGIKAIHVDGFWFKSLIPILKIARDRGIITTMDPSSSVTMPMADEIFPFIDYLIPSYHYVSRLAGHGRIDEIGRQLQQYGCKAVVITKGEEGAFIYSDEEMFHLPAFSIHAIDTTGAGDTFHGAFIAGLLKGYDIINASRFASAAAAIKCTKIGGQAGIPFFEETRQFLRSRGLEFNG